MRLLFVAAILLAACHGDPATPLTPAERPHRQPVGSFGGSEYPEAKGYHGECHNETWDSYYIWQGDCEHAICAIRGTGSCTPKPGCDGPLLCRSGGAFATKQTGHWTCPNEISCGNW